jgi:hypothetical protein
MTGRTLGAPPRAGTPPPRGTPMQRYRNGYALTATSFQPLASRCQTAR